MTLASLANDTDQTHAYWATVNPAGSIAGRKVPIETDQQLRGAICGSYTASLWDGEEYTAHVVLHKGRYSPPHLSAESLKANDGPTVKDLANFKAYLMSGDTHIGTVSQWARASTKHLRQLLKKREAQQGRIWKSVLLTMYHGNKLTTWPDAITIQTYGKILGQDDDGKWKVRVDVTFNPIPISKKVAIQTSSVPRAVVPPATDPQAPVFPPTATSVPNVNPQGPGEKKLRSLLFRRALKMPVGTFPRLLSSWLKSRVVARPSAIVCLFCSRTIPACKVTTID